MYGERGNRAILVTHDCYYYAIILIISEWTKMKYLQSITFLDLFDAVGIQVEKSKNRRNTCECEM